MSIYRFDVERRQYVTLWIEGETEDDAREDAEIFAAEMPYDQWIDEEVDVVSLGAQSPSKSVTVWSGGPDGHDYVFRPEVTP